MFLRRLPPRLLGSSRQYSTPVAANFAKARQAGGEGPPAATSTSAAQPLSAPFTPGPVKPVTLDPPKSATPAGTVLKAINYYKNKSDPVALEDNQYPPWLWTAVEDSSSNKSGAGGEEDLGDLYSKSKKARRLATKRAAKLAALEAANPEKKVPLNEQTVDLPFATSEKTPMKRTVSAVGLELPPTMQGPKTTTAKALKPSVVTIGGESEVKVSAQEAERARLALRKELRKKGRAGIKERNFLGQL